VGVRTYVRWGGKVEEGRALPLFPPAPGPPLILRVHTPWRPLPRKPCLPRRLASYPQGHKGFRGLERVAMRGLPCALPLKHTTNSAIRPIRVLFNYISKSALNRKNI
jgi:hypothetical protein